MNNVAVKEIFLKINQNTYVKGSLNKYLSIHFLKFTLVLRILYFVSTKF